MGAHAQRFDGATAHLGQLRIVPGNNAERVLDVGDDVEFLVEQLGAKQVTAEPERGLSAHHRFGIFEQAHQHAREISLFILPHRLDRLRAHLHVVIEQPCHEDVVEVVLDVIFGEVDESIDQVAASLDAQGAPDFEEPPLIGALDRAETHEFLRGRLVVRLRELREQCFEGHATACLRQHFRATHAAAARSVTCSLGSAIARSQRSLSRSTVEAATGRGE